MSQYKQYVLATTSVLALMTSAQAADMRTMPAKAPPPELIRYWDGFYLGINGGALWHNATADLDYVLPGGATTSTSVDLTPALATFGGQIGYNRQAGHLVYGVEADLNWVSANAASTATILATQNVNFSSKMSWLATVRGRLGLTFSPTLVYVTGGLAVAHVHNAVDFSGPPAFTVDDEKTRTGWTVGGGIEHFFAPHWSAKAEVLYVDLGREDFSTTPFGPGTITYRGSFRNTAVVGRVGLNWTW